MSTAVLLLHPVRMRIVQSLLGGRQATTTDLKERLPDVAPATLYRQIATLLEGRVLEVVEERRVRGTYERTLRLVSERLVVGPADAAELSAEEHSRGFLAFTLARLADFDRYLSSGDVDLARDRVGYRINALYLDDDEVDAFIDEVGEVVRRWMRLEPGGRRRRRVLSTVLMPADEAGERPVDGEAQQGEAAVSSDA